MDASDTLNQPVRSRMTFRDPALLLRMFLCLSVLVLILSTFRLWFPDGRFPIVPFAVVPDGLPLVVDAALSSLLLMLLSGTILSGWRALASGNDRLTAKLSTFNVRFIQGSLLVSLVLVMLNQHRLQPWLYHFWLLALVLIDKKNGHHVLEPDNSTCQREVVPAQSPITRSRVVLLEPSSARLLRCVCLLTAGIYFWSGWSKLDATFLSGYGQQFVEAILNSVGLSLRFWNETTRMNAAAVLPVGEILVAGLLLFWKTRAAGLRLSFIMHGLLLLAVGPFGLNHEAGVLLWNVWFLVQNGLLLKISRGTKTEVSPSCRANGRSLADVVLLASLFLPAVRGSGLWDNWPSWAVYASAPARMRILVRDDHISKLPIELQDCIERRSVDDGWSWLRLDWWSLRTVNAPLYPQPRFQLALALAIARDCAMPDGVRIVYEGEAARLTGVRTTQVATGLAELERWDQRFVWNAVSRPNWMIRTHNEPEASARELRFPR